MSSQATVKQTIGEFGHKFDYENYHLLILPILFLKKKYANYFFSNILLLILLQSHSKENHCLANSKLGRKRESKTIHSSIFTNLPFSNIFHFLLLHFLLFNNLASFEYYLILYSILNLEKANHLSQNLIDIFKLLMKAVSKYLVKQLLFIL